MSKVEKITKLNSLAKDDGATTDERIAALQAIKRIKDKPITVQEFLESTFDPIDEFQVRKPVMCNDGYNVSIQGGTIGHYCNPRKHINEYKAVELGFPSEADDLIMEYAEEEDKPTGTVYGYVPIEVVEQLIAKHGGIITE